MDKILDLTAQHAAVFLPRRREDGHKGDFGKLLIVGGAVSYTGAPYLAASAAVHSGCGLVHLGVPQSIWAVEAVKCTGAMPFPLPEQDGRLCASALPEIQKKLNACDVLALGPGLGRSEALTQLVRALLRETTAPVVLDADGLNALSCGIDALDERAERVTILTPHPAEFARLCGCSLEMVLAGDQAQQAHDFAQKRRCTLVLKGHRTIIALPDGTLYRSTTGCSALSKGGSGDVLTGLIASLLCQGADAEAAACCGVWLHGRAGEVLARARTAYCAAPEDLISLGFPAVFRELLC